MALVKVYRAAYKFNDSEPCRVHFTDWVCAEGMDEAEAMLMAVNPPMHGGNPGVVPTIIGWEEKELDTEPS